MCAPLGTLRAAVHADVRAHVLAAVLLPLLRNCKWSVPAAYVPDYAYAPIAKPRDGLPIRLVRV